MALDKGPFSREIETQVQAIHSAESASSAGQQPIAARSETSWGPLKRFLFRVAFVYLILYILPFPLNHAWYFAGLPEPMKFIAACGSQTERWYVSLWNVPVVWGGEHIFGVTPAILTSNDDTTYHYVKTFCHLVLATATAVLWTLFARSRTGCSQLHHALRVYVRFALASWMIIYASFKVFKIQFANPGLSRLMQPVGDLSPMSLMWTFMGASEGYVVFVGVGELLAGLLLTFRRTTLLGALLCAVIMAHVLVLNLCYDVCVKLFSLHLLLMALFLTLPDLPRLANLFLLGRAAEPIEIRRLFQRPWLDRLAVAARTVLVLGFTALLLTDDYLSRRAVGDLRPMPPLYGIWAVQEFAVDGQFRPPLLTDASRWHLLIIDRPGSVLVRFMDRSRQIYEQTSDIEARTLTLRKGEDPAWKATLAWERPEPDVLNLEGILDGKSIRVRCQRVDESLFPLITRGFHWINERPFLH